MIEHCNNSTIRVDLSYFVSYKSAVKAIKQTIPVTMRGE